MRNIIFSTSLILLFILSSCSKGVDPGPEFEELALTSFDDLKVGDVLQYTLFSGENYFDQDNQKFDYTDDYLNVEIIEILTNGYRVKEWIDNSSNMFNTTDNYYYHDKNEVYYNDWIIVGDEIRIEKTTEDYNASHLFIDKFSTLIFDLDEFNGEEIEITSWKTDRAFSESDADFYVKDFELLDNVYDHLNVVVRDGPMAADGNGNTYLYSQEAGFVRSVTYSAWTGRGLGWDRLR